MNWNTDSTARLDNFSLDLLLFCSSSNPISKPCRFFFCRIREFFKKTFGKEPPPQRRRGTDNRTRNTAANDWSFENCENLKDLFSFYDVNNTKDLLEAIFRPLYEKYRVKNLNELKKKFSSKNELFAELQKVHRENRKKRIEERMGQENLNMADFNYYIFNSSGFGWKNIDAFTKMSSEMLTSFNALLIPDQHKLVRTVFPLRKILMFPSFLKDGYEFKPVPKRETAIIVALKYENKKPYIGIKEVKVSHENYDIELVEVTLDELKKKVRILDLNY